MDFKEIAFIGISIFSTTACDHAKIIKHCKPLVWDHKLVGLNENDFLFKVGTPPCYQTQFILDDNSLKDLRRATLDYIYPRYKENKYLIREMVWDDNGIIYVAWIGPDPQGKLTAPEERQVVWVMDYSPKTTSF